VFTNRWGHVWWGPAPTCGEWQKSHGGTIPGEGHLVLSHGFLSLNQIKPIWKNHMF
jgi:hypothetical protein